MDGAWFSYCWLFGLSHPSTGASESCWVRQVSVPKWWPVEELTLRNIPWCLCHNCPFPHCGHSQLSPLLKPTGRSGLGSYEVTALPCISMHVKPCVEFHTRVEFYFPSSIEFLQSNPASLQIKCSGGSSHWCQTSRLGTLMWDSEISLLWENLCHRIIFQFLCHPANKYGIWLYHRSFPPTISLWLLLCFWLYNIFFGWFQSFFVGGYSAVQASLGAQLVKNLPSLWEIWVQSLGWEDLLEKGKATHSSIMAWRIPWTV